MNHKLQLPQVNRRNPIATQAFSAGLQAKILPLYSLLHRRKLRPIRRAIAWVVQRLLIAIAP
ncbi:hypothetical protein [Marinagarivorans cellulosilyticus]|uniref:hypothetical protein n=1 Tax=Marinagarivorans cellulosilyticus TaxID=2721545 RepID=UPI001F295058|nr:hypothetical protein [Marinagarivorans cellulosilyticus]